MDAKLLKRHLQLLARSSRIHRAFVQSIPDCSHVRGIADLTLAFSDDMPNGVYADGMLNFMNMEQEIYACDLMGGVIPS